MTDPRCPVDIPFADVQGNILTGYGRQGFPYARFGVVNVSDADKGREFVQELQRHVTTAARWESRRKPGLAVGRAEVPRPKVTLNLAFTFYGLHALGVPTRTLRGLPDEFIDGMAARCEILGDNTIENPRSAWDPVWLPDSPQKRVHILVMLNAQMDDAGDPVPELDAMCAKIVGLCQRLGKVTLLPGHRGGDDYWQHLEAIKDKDGVPCAKEHFGYTDGISDPVFQGQYAQAQEVERARGFGATDGAGNWRPLAAGEFLLGWPDEAQEIAGSALPLDFSRNGTFFAYRKLHQDIDGFYAWVDQAARQLQRIWRIDDHEEAKEILLAKMAGRWSDGVPLMAAPTYQAWKEFNERHPPTGKHEVRNDSERERKMVDFLYRTDPAGTRCPMTSHIRRTNTRDMLDPRGDSDDPKSRMGSALNNRRRIVRRGLPYGKAGAADKEHGVIMMVVCASLQRQFEFVQQQWVNYGLDSNAGNDPDPVIGNHGEGAKFTIAADPESGNPPFIATGLTQWVQTRGGDYFFMPSMTALRMIGMGVVDPT